MSDTEKLCKHELWELDTAIQDGHCPLCMQSRLAKLSEANSHLSAVNERLKQTVRYLLIAGHDLASITECFCMDLSDQRGLSSSCETCLWVEAEKIADEMGEK